MRGEGLMGQVGKVKSSRERWVGSVCSLIVLKFFCFKSRSQSLAELELFPNLLRVTLIVYLPKRY